MPRALQADLLSMLLASALAAQQGPGIPPPGQQLSSDPLISPIMIPSTSPQVQAPAPYHGYYFRFLRSQDPDALGEAFEHLFGNAKPR